MMPGAAINETFGVRFIAFEMSQHAAHISMPHTVERGSDTAFEVYSLRSEFTHFAERDRVKMG